VECESEAIPLIVVITTDAAGSLSRPFQKHLKAMSVEHSSAELHKAAIRVTTAYILISSGLPWPCGNAETPAILSDVFRAFSQSPQADVGIVSHGDDRYLPHLYQSISRLTIRC
jgi:hypothetical protein